MKIKIGSKIKDMRKQADITQERLAEYLGVSAQAVSRWEGEVCYPDMETLPAIADYFHVTLDELCDVNHAKKEAAIQRYVAEGNTAQLLGHFETAVAIYRQAVAVYPSSFWLQVELACAIGAMDNGLRIPKALCDEVIAIGRRVLEDCREDALRLRMLAVLGWVYQVQMEDTAKARETLEKLPSVSQCREVAYAETLKLRLPAAEAQENIEMFIGQLLVLLGNPQGYEYKTQPRECVQALIKELEGFAAR